MRTVLLVDDDEDFCTVIEQTLEEAKFAVVTALSLEAAYEVIRSKCKIDLALIDFWLGKKNSVPIFDAIVENDPDTKLIMITGGFGDFPIEASYSVAQISGSTGFLQKPFTRHALLSAVEHVWSVG